MNYHCPGCNTIMMPKAIRHTCTNHSCGGTLELKLPALEMPRDPEPLLTEADLKHMLLALTHLNRRESAKKCDVTPGSHGRAINLAIRKLTA